MEPQVLQLHQADAAIEQADRHVFAVEVGIVLTRTSSFLPFSIGTAIARPRAGAGPRPFRHSP